MSELNLLPGGILRKKGLSQLCLDQSHKKMQGTRYHDKIDKDKK